MHVIGRRDRIDLPQFGLNDIEAKVDTGAYGCALHCHHIEVIEKDGKDVLSFQLLDPSHPEYEDKIYHTSNFRDKKVKNSGGSTENRYTIKTEVIIFNKKRKVEFSLTDREKMKFPVLLGRKFLTKSFLVDVREKDLSYKLKKSYTT